MLRQLTADVEAEADAGHPDDGRAGATVETIEDLLTLVVSNADAAVLDANDGPPRVGRNVDEEPGWWSRIREAVVDQVVQHPAQLTFVALHADHVRGQAHGNICVQEIGPWSSAGDRVFHDLAQVHDLTIQRA